MFLRACACAKGYEGLADEATEALLRLVELLGDAHDEEEDEEEEEEAAAAGDT
jgi:hypothetical protein